jgi:hypothetical protein
MPWSGWSADCACGVRRSPEDLFLLTPNPMLPSMLIRNESKR